MNVDLSTKQGKGVGGLYPSKRRIHGEYRRVGDDSERIKVRSEREEISRMCGVTKVTIRVKNKLRVRSKSGREGDVQGRKNTTYTVRRRVVFR